MTELVVVGSLALDTVKTPFGEVKDALGGAATYSSYAASFFSKPGIVGVVGHDFPEKHLQLLQKRGVDTSGVAVDRKGKTFRWHGYYEYDMNEAKTIKTELGVFADFKPQLPESYKDA
ncbi:MAG: PfkB family carbohydrate kinase, partial [Nanoarchaeota archaeon]